MTNLNPAPRPLRLWGVDIPDATRLQVIENQHSVKVMEWSGRASASEWVCHAEKYKRDFKERFALYQEATTAIHNALHPLLDVEDALNKNLICEDDVIACRRAYAYIVDYFMEPFYKGGELFISLGCENGYSTFKPKKGFKPLSWIDGTDPAAIAADRERFASVNVANREGVAR